MKLLIIRPEPGASATAVRAKAAGFEPILMPLFAIAPRPWQASLPDAFDAMLFTSANAVRHAGEQLDAYRALPAHAVGARTASALRDMGIEPATTGNQGVDEALLAGREAGHCRLLWLAGEEHINPSLPEGMTVETALCYASDPLPMPDDAVRHIAEADCVALHSPRAAQHFSNLVDDLDIERSSIIIAAFSPAIAAAAGAGWSAVAIAAQPTDSALLSALASLGKR